MEESKVLIAKLGGLMRGTDAQTMLSPGISASYQSVISSRSSHADVETVVPPARQGNGSCDATTALFRTDAKTFLANPELSEEVFGPSTSVISYSDREQLLQLAGALEGQLTATIHGSEEELRANSDLLRILETKVGRLLFNGYPTGVEVCHSIVHGGPYPPTSDGRSTSVGTRAIFRFARQVCFQGFPNAALPDELKDENPLGIWRLVDGKLTQK